MIATTLKRGRTAAALIVAVTALAISVAPSYSAQGAHIAAPAAACGGGGNCG